jgi:hypothetical protein
MTEQPENGINTLSDDGAVWVDITCGSPYGGMCNVGLASAKTKGAALRRAARRLREMADQCEEASKANEREQEQI